MKIKQNHGRLSIAGTQGVGNGELVQFNTLEMKSTSHGGLGIAGTQGHEHEREVNGLNDESGSNQAIGFISHGRSSIAEPNWGGNGKSDVLCEVEQDAETCGTETDCTELSTAPLGIREELCGDREGGGARPFSVQYQENLYVQGEQVTALVLDSNDTEGQVNGINAGDDGGPMADGL